MAGELSTDERAELERLRAEAASRIGLARGGRWVGACALFVLAALLGGFAVVAGYVRGEVLDTTTYVETVAPLTKDPAVRDAVSNRLADEIVTRADVSALATEVATRLVAQGAPDRITDLVAPAVNGLRSFLQREIYDLLASARFQEAWEQANRVGHTGLVTVLTGGQGQVVASTGTTVTVDLGALLSVAKQELAQRGLSFVERIPDVSIPYQLVESQQLPTIRRYTDLLNTTATWLPWIALVLLGLGLLVAPDRRRGLVTAFALLAVVAALLWSAVALGRAYYLDNLPDTIHSPDAAAVVIDTMLRYLVGALQTLLAVSLVLVLAGLIAGPSRWATALRRLADRALDAGGRLLARTGTWATTTGRYLVGARAPLRIVAVAVALVALIAAARPGIPTVLWWTAGVLLFLAVVELFARAAPSRPAGA